MSAKPQKAVLLQTIFVNGEPRFQKGVVVDLFSICEAGAFISVDRNSFCVPHHFLTIIPPDSPRVHKHKNKSNKRKKPQKNKEL